jgi:hypothetical protein
MSIRNRVKARTLIFAALVLTRCSDPDCGPKADHDEGTLKVGGAHGRIWSAENLNNAGQAALFQWSGDLNCASDADPSVKNICEATARAGRMELPGFRPTLFVTPSKDYRFVKWVDSVGRCTTDPYADLTSTVIAIGWQHYDPEDDFGGKFYNSCGAMFESWPGYHPVIDAVTPNDPVAGNPVVVTGSDLGAMRSRIQLVRPDGKFVMAPITAGSDIQLNVTIPVAALPGPTTLTLLAPDGTATAPITVYTIPPAVVDRGPKLDVGQKDRPSPDAPKVDAQKKDAPGPLKVDLSGKWDFCQDGAAGVTLPYMNLGTVTSSSVTVGYDGGAAGALCDCNAMHLVIPLGRTFPCSSTTMEFDYNSTGTFSDTSTSSLSIRFCNGTCSTAAHYSGAQFLGSTLTNKSACAYLFTDQFPATPQLKNGHNTISVGSLKPSLNGSCTGSFDTIDVHLQGYGCLKGKDQGQSTLSNLQLY